MRLTFKVQSLRFKAAAHLCVALVTTVIATHGATTNSVQTTNLVAAKTNAPANVSTNATTGIDFPSFKIINERNIFSANRSGRVVSRGPTRQPTKVDTFTLVGTIDYSKGMFAIFDGSSSSLRKTVKVGDSIADFKIADVDLDHVTITTTNGADTVLHVGSQMRRVDEGDWAPGTGPTPQVAKTSEPKDSDAPAAADKNSDSSDDPAPSADTSEILKKLMQKRKAEVKNESE
jgi:hypothetical protein